MKKTGILIIVFIILMSSAVLGDERNATLGINSSTPDVSNVRLRDGSLPEDELTLEAGKDTTFTCYADVTDPDGNADIRKVAAELYGPSSYFGDYDGTKYHYTNSSCDYDSEYGDATCTFPNIEFYTEPGEWHCQINASDYNINVNDSEKDNATVLELAAINISDSLLIDFGNVYTGRVSDAKSTVFENEGNVDLDVELDVYKNSDINDSDSMDCDSGTLPAESINASETESGLTSGVSMAATGTETITTSLSPPILDDQDPPTDTIWWNLKVPSSGALGRCNGKVLFGAMTP
ncbi:MAG: hypothetical protein ACQEP1_01255 [Nanobdellota archaeon]